MKLNSSSYLCFASLLTSATALADQLPPGFVQGDVVSYSYVPNKRWTINEGYGILPYIGEYGILKFQGDDYPLETFHAENVRRIDQVSQWSTVVMFYARENVWRDEMINLMIRSYSKRQLIILRNSWKPGQADPFRNTVDIIESLWANRDTALTDPEGDQATGRQVINNILAIKTGDEGECGLRTSGLQSIFATFESVVQNRVMDGQQPFQHIKVWYNMLQYGVGCHAASQYDVDHYGRFLLPTNTECIGVDTYHFWNGSDPLTMTSAQRRSISDSWQNVITRYYPGGLSVSPCGSWTPQCRSDTHALLNGRSAAGAGESMLFYIANSCTPPDYHTTPIETMDAFYDSLKPGPWIGLFWYTYYGSPGSWEGTTAYLDKTLEHFTGSEYTEEQLDDFHDRFIASRMRIFNDVVYNQFGYLNNLPTVIEVAPDPDTTLVGAQYVRQLQLVYPGAQVTWSVTAGPPGVQVDTAGRVHGWTPACSQSAQSFTITVRAQNAVGVDDETWQIEVWAAADFNRDNDVDQEDFGHFQACLSGSGQPRPDGCADADLDADGDVDPSDFSTFQSYVSGPGMPPGC